MVLHILERKEKGKQQRQRVEVRKEKKWSQQWKINECKWTKEADGSFRSESTESRVGGE